jgi:hypothetical protein
MDIVNKFIIIVFLGIHLCSITSAASLGAAPSNIDLGVVEPGDTVEKEIYVRVSNVDNNFTISPYANGIAPITLFESYDSSRLSEKSSSSWWDFEESIVNPNTEIPDNQINLENNNLPTLHGYSKGTLTVPADAEPGIRRGHIQLGSDLSSSGTDSGASAGARFIAPTRISYVFDVAGNVKRDVIVQDIRGIRTDTNRASIELLLSNEGTTTVTSQNFEIDIQRRDNTIDTLTAKGITLEPGETQWTNAYWTGSQVDEGQYYLDGEVDYFTGSAYASGSFSLGDIVTVEQAPDDSPVTDGQDSRETVPMWLVFMVLAIMAVLMWSFDIEPFWIMAIVGGLAISAFILLSGVSNYLLVVLLMAVGIVVYGVM